MKKILAGFILTFSLFSCEPPLNEEVQVVQGNTTETKSNAATVKNNTEKKEDQDDSNARATKNSKPLLIARGSEPGWYAEFFENRLRLLIDNGTDSLILPTAFNEIVFRENFSMTHSENIKDKKPVDLTISIENKACTEEGSGEKREKSISITYNKKTYKGCATAVVK